MDMTAPKKKTGLLDRLRYRYVLACDLADRFSKEVRGVAAVEFAFIAPLMLLMYVGTIEISGAISANRKLSRVASTLGDLVTQVDSCISDSDMTQIMKFADDIMYPYTQNVAVVITGIQIDSNGIAKVAWSKANQYGTAKAKDSIYTVPAQIRIADNFLVAANVQMTYMPIYGWMHYEGPASVSVDKNSGLDMNEELFLRPRIGASIENKTSCP